MSEILDTPEQPYIQRPPEANYVFRGHAVQIHSLCFLRDNNRLLSGDVDGWAVFWNLHLKRAIAVWRAHDNSILGVGGWDSNKIITHGRDSKLNVWQLSEEDENTRDFSTVLPVTDLSARIKPLLLHSLGVNTLNFCVFSMCLDKESLFLNQESLQEVVGYTSDDADSALIAVPGIHDAVDIFQLPSERKLWSVPAVGFIETNTLMAVQLVFRFDDKSNLILLTGYESGHAAVHTYDISSGIWTVIYLSKAHSLPILSLVASSSCSDFYTSSIDSIIAKHSIPPISPTEHQSVTSLVPAQAIIKTRHAGQQSLAMRSDGRIFASAGWDGRVRVYSVKTNHEVAILKWHRGGCYSVAFAPLDTEVDYKDRPEVYAFPLDDEKAKKINYLILPKISGKTRMIKTQTTHWVAVGAKDGNISLWSIF